MLHDTVRGTHLGRPIDRLIVDSVCKADRSDFVDKLWRRFRIWTLQVDGFVLDCGRISSRSRISVIACAMMVVITVVGQLSVSRRPIGEFIPQQFSLFQNLFILALLVLSPFKKKQTLVKVSLNSPSNGQIKFKSEAN